MPSAALQAQLALNHIAPVALSTINPLFLLLLMVRCENKSRICPKLCTLVLNNWYHWNNNQAYKKIDQTWFQRDGEERGRQQKYSVVLNAQFNQ